VAYWNGWPRWWGNDVERIGPYLEQVDRAARDAGRDPREVCKTAAVFIRLKGGIVPGNPDAPHVSGSAEGTAALLLQFAGLRIEHFQIVLDPITTDGSERFAPVLELVRSSSRLSII